MDLQFVALGMTVPEAGLIAVIINDEWEIWCSILVSQAKVRRVIKAHVSSLPEVSHSKQEDDFDVVVFNAGILIGS